MFRGCSKYFYFYISLFLHGKIIEILKIMKISHIWYTERPLNIYLYQLPFGWFLIVKMGIT